MSNEYEITIASLDKEDNERTDKFLVTVDATYDDFVEDLPEGAYHEDPEYWPSWFEDWAMDTKFFLQLDEDLIESIEWLDTNEDEDFSQSVDRNYVASFNKIPNKDVLQLGASPISSPRILLVALAGLGLFLLFKAPR